MMNDVAVVNITRILNEIIGKGDNAIGIISIDKSGHVDLCWRTDDPARAAVWEQALMSGVRQGVQSREFVPLPDAQ